MKVYAAKNKDDAIRLKSSSGGLFSLLAEEIIRNKGIVVGAVWNDLDVKHVAIDDMQELHALRKSKYVKSTVDTSLYNFTDKEVLFSGTPCQMPSKKKDNYTYLSVVCHGTPTKQSFQEYCEKTNIKYMNFRNKETGWTNFHVTYELHNGEIISQPFQENEFMQDFLNNRNLTKMCYNCPFKEFKDNSDIMLGDFWGVGDEYPDFADNQGISVVFIKTEKGEQLFDKIKEKIEYIEVDVNKVIKYNPSIIKSAERK